MSMIAGSTTTVGRARDWASALKLYRAPSAARASFEIAVTLIPFLALWASMLFAVCSGHWRFYALAIAPAGALLVRLFMIQHDCGHGSFFPNRAANDWTGRVIAILTLTPYDHWRRSHAIHHATSGNLDGRGVGDISTMTVREYFAAGRWGRLRYRLYRHPIVIFGLGPFYLFVVQQRLPLGFMRKGLAPWISTMSTNAGVSAAGALLIWTFGPWPFLIVHLPIVLIGATAGVWLFYVQHQFELTRWDSKPAWEAQEAALHGSSHYDLPAVLRWFTANIGVHHVHHVSMRIPYYRLQDVLRDHPSLRTIGRITLLESLACVRLTLWDEDKRKLVSFRDAALPQIQGTEMG
jgi:omega-6 fatty acid desaturase (delta-12 desaturase)